MFINLWAEQAVVEEHLVMDIVFLLYFDPLCSCSFMRWKELFVMFKVSTKTFAALTAKSFFLSYMLSRASVFHPS